MMLITILLVFLAGFAFASWGMPFLDNVFNTFAVWIQQIQGKMAVNITEDQVKTTKLKQELETQEQTSTHVIGFTIPNIEEDEEEYEDDE